MKVTEISRSAKSSRHGDRFYTRLDMAVIKHDEAVKNAQIKRGEVVPRGNNHAIRHCGCGAEGCFLHYSYPNK